MLAAADDVYEKLLAAGIDVLLRRPRRTSGVKFKDADLIGFPLRIAVGAKSLANGHIEWSWRKDPGRNSSGAPDEVLATVIDAVRTSRV